MAIGIITGSGTYALPGFEGGGPEPVATPWGEALVSRGTFAGVEVLHISRHGAGHPRLSNHVTHRANIAALKELGAAGVIAVTVCGAVDPSVELGSLVCFDDLHFLANRLRRRRSCARSSPSRATRGAATGSTRVRSRRTLRARAARGRGGGGRERPRRRLLRPRRRPALQHPGRDPRARGLRASPRSPRPPGPETVLCGEAELPYALLGYATDYANGVQDEATPVETLLEMMAASTEAFAAVLRAARAARRRRASSRRRAWSYRFEG